jgi:hypothetical protein
MANFFDQNMQFINPYMGLREGSKPSAFKREHPALQNMKLIHFSIFSFLFLWVIFPLLDPDPHSPIAKTSFMLSRNSKIEFLKSSKSQMFVLSLLLLQ